MYPELHRELYKLSQTHLVDARDNDRPNDYYGISNGERLFQFACDDLL